VESGATPIVVEDEVARADGAWAWPLSTALTVTTNATVATIARRLNIARLAAVRVRRIWLRW
jgi:hypothetical protein